MGVLAAGLLVVSASGLAQGGTLRDPDLGDSIEIPAGWTFTRPDPASVRFEVDSGVARKIQNVLSAARGGAYADLGSFVASLKCQLAAGADTISISSAGAFDVYDADGTHLDGWQFLTDYSYGGGAVREWYGIAARAPGDVFYVSPTRHPPAPTRPTSRR